MMKKLAYLIILFSLTACQETALTGFQDKPVVESYLYAESTPSVKISKLIPFTSDMVFSDMDVNKLTVSITEQVSGKKYSLTGNGEGIYTSSDLIITPGKSYQLSFPYNDQTVSATTLVPEKPQNLTLSASSISIEQRGTGLTGPPEMPSPIEINWTNTDQSYYLVVVKNVESVKTAIDTRESTAKDFFRNQPVNTDHYEINARSFKFYGMHRVILYKIQPEYVLYFQENSTSSISITEIRANIENGFGIFTAINSVSAYLYVGKP
jgi:hypothetical protein